MATSAGGTTQDNIKKSYVKSPSRGGNETAQEVVIGRNFIEDYELVKICLLQEMLKEIKDMKLILSETTGVDI